MIDPFDLYQSFASFVNTHQGGHFRINRDFINAVNDESGKLWEQETGEAEKSQSHIDHLDAFLKSLNVSITELPNQVHDVAKLPKDYGRYSSARIRLNKSQVGCGIKDMDILKDGKVIPYKDADEILLEKLLPDEDVTEYPITKIDNQRWGSVLRHITKGPKNDKPYVNQIKVEDVSSLKIAPKQLGIIVLDYYVRPKQATLIYNVAPGNIVTGSGEGIIYDKAKSQPLEWPETMRNEFVIRLGERYGLFTREQFVMQASRAQR